MNDVIAQPLAVIQKMGENLWALSPKILLGVFVVAISYFLSKLVRSWIRKLAERSKKRRNIGFVLGRLSQFFIIFFGVFIALTIVFPSVKAGTLVQFFGISSVAIGFAFKDILQNFLAGILILLNEPFEIGDQIKVKDLEGTVEDIQTRATFIKTYDGRRIVIPNSVLFTESVIVNTAFNYRRNECIVGIGFGDDVTEAEEAILTALGDVPGVLKEPAPDTIVTELGASAVNIRVRWWSRPEIAEYLKVQSQVIAAIKTALGQEGIDLPFPTTQVLFHDQTEVTDGDRARQREGWPAGDEPPESRFKFKQQIDAEPNP